MWKALLLLISLLAALSLSSCWKGRLVANGMEGRAWAAGGSGPDVYHCVASGGQATCKAVVEKEK